MSGCGQTHPPDSSGLFDKLNRETVQERRSYVRVQKAPKMGKSAFDWRKKIVDNRILENCEKWLS